MSEREKYRTRGGYYLLIRNPDNAIDEFSALVKQFPADTAGIANLAFAYFVKRDMANALTWGRRAIEIYPKNVPQRNNFGLIAMYAGDFETGAREQKTVLQMNSQFVLAYVGLALSELGAGRPEQALATWNRLAGNRPRGGLLRRRGAGRPRALPGTDRRRPHDPRDRDRGGRRREEHGRGRPQADDARRGGARERPGGARDRRRRAGHGNERRPGRRRQRRPGSHRGGRGEESARRGGAARGAPGARSADVRRAPAG